MVLQSCISIAQVVTFLVATVTFWLPCVSHALSSRRQVFRNCQLPASSSTPSSPSQKFLITSSKAHRNSISRLSAAAGDEPVTTRNAIPIDGSRWPDRFPAREHCSRCGLCETSFVSKVTNACAFLGEGMARMDSMESKVHGRTRELEDLAWSSSSSQMKNDEGRFGVLQEPIQLAKGIETEAQWTGCVTGIALSMLESNMVDAVVCIANQNHTPGSGGWAVPEPILARTPDEVLRGRGVKVRYINFIAVLDDHTSSLIILNRTAGVSTKLEGVGRSQE